VATVTITRLARFSAAHRLHNPKFSDAENATLFGKCNSPNYHGHNYTLEVTIAGTPDVKTGYVMDFGDLDRIVDRACIDLLDHKNLDLDVDFLKGVLSTAENICVACWGQLEAPLREQGARLARLRLWETENNYVEYDGK
jgi:6-pyruvoyltetrahydropterin/6-carboxytetrahydropterin synthase